MSSLAFVSVLLVLIASLGIVNYRTLRLPRAIALMAGSLVISIALILTGRMFGALDPRYQWNLLLAQGKLPHLFLDGVLAFMLFAGSLHVDVDALRTQKWTVLALATIGVVLATGLYGAGIWFVFGGTVPLSWCVVLGALLAPTDPIAVGGLLREAGLPPALLAVVNGESLFNDGVAVVVFGLALEWANGHAASPGGVLLELLREAGGGITLGWLTGYTAYRALRLIDDPALELTVTLALATATYSISHLLGVSGPLAVVVAGLLTGHRATRFAMTDLSREQVVLVWDMMDEVLNATLFLLIGFSLLSVPFNRILFQATAAGVALALVTRLISVAIPATLVHLRHLPSWNGVAVLTWGGLRGGISIALALTLEPSPYRGALLAVCYGVVTFTILVQGLTMPLLVRRLYWQARP